MSKVIWYKRTLHILVNIRTRPERDLGYGGPTFDQGSWRDRYDLLWDWVEDLASVEIEKIVGSMFQL